MLREESSSLLHLMSCLASPSQFSDFIIGLQQGSSGKTAGQFQTESQFAILLFAGDTGDEPAEASPCPCLRCCLYFCASHGPCLQKDAQAKASEAANAEADLQELRQRVDELSRQPEPQALHEQLRIAQQRVDSRDASLQQAQAACRTLEREAERYRRRVDQLQHRWADQLTGSIATDAGPKTRWLSRITDGWETSPGRVQMPVASSFLESFATHLKAAGQRCST